MRSPLGRDAALVVAVVGLDLVLFSTLLNEGPPSGTPAWIIVGYALVGGAVLFWQRRYPWPGFLVLWLHAVGSIPLSGYQPTLPLLVGLYTVAAHASFRTAAAALAATAVPLGAAVTEGVREAPPGERMATLAGLSILLGLVHCGAFGIGRWARAVRHRTRALEHTRDSAARDAVEVERARIAGELHDIVGHSVTVMTLHAAGAKKVMRHDPGRAEEALAHVGGAGAQAMSELRRMLGALRPGDGAGLRCLDELLSTVRSTGVTVDVTCTGAAVDLEPAADLVAYRLIQEALTNVVRHAGPGAHATVTLDRHPDSLEITVTDDGRGRPVDGPRLSTGHGLTGAAARVAALGGRLDWGPAGEGFRVGAAIPVPVTRERSDDAAARAAG
jgi:signal transduction histidine kinase